MKSNVWASGNSHTHTTSGHFMSKSSENYQYWDLKAQPEPVLFQSHERALGLSPFCSKVTNGPWA